MMNSGNDKMAPLNKNEPAKGFFGAAIEDLRAQIAAQQESTDRLTLATTRNGEIQQRHADAAESLVTRINSMPLD